MNRDRVLLRCHVCDCWIQDGEPYTSDAWGWTHTLCTLQVEL